MFASDIYRTFGVIFTAVLEQTKIMKRRLTRETNQRFSRLDKMNIDNRETKCYCAVNRVKPRLSVSKFVLILVVLLSCFLEICVVLGDMRTDKRNTQSETTTNCANCQYMREDKRKVAVLNIKQKILNAMGLPEAPKYTKRVYPPLNQIIGLYEPEIPHSSHTPHRHKNMNSVVDDYEDDERIKVSSEIYEAEPYDLDEGIKMKELYGAEPCPSCLKLNGQRPVIFKLEKNMMSNEYHVITLMLYSNSSQYCKENVNITIYKLFQGPGTKETYKPIRTTQTKIEDDSWIRIEFKDAILNHLETSMTEVNNITLVIMALYIPTESHSECTEFNKNLAFHPVLEFQLTEKTNKRIKRTPKMDCKENGNISDCCRYPLIIDFDEFEWDFIIAPRRYEAYYCAGECPYLFKNSLPYTQLQQLSNKTKVGPCCSPKKMSAISMLYFTSKGTILFGRIGGMVVEKCGCS